MVERDRKGSSAANDGISREQDYKQQRGTNRWRRIVKIFSALIVIVLIGSLIWACLIGKVSVFLGALAEWVGDLVNIIVVLVGAGIGAIAALKKGWSILGYCCIIFIIGITLVAAIKIPLKVGASMVSDAEGLSSDKDSFSDLGVESDDSERAVSSTQDSAENSAEEDGGVVVTVRKYIFEEDAYMEHIEYYTCLKPDVTEEQKIALAAEIIKECMAEEYRGAAVETSLNYDNLVIEAEWIHNAYFGMVDNVPEAINKDIEREGRSVMIDLLDQAITKRELANNEKKSAENLRGLANYYIELGDEYARNGEEEKAAQSYEEAGKHAMRSLYLSVPANNKEKSEDGLKCVEMAKDHINSLASIGEERKGKLSTIYKIYKEIVERM